MTDQRQPLVHLDGGLPSGLTGRSASRPPGWAAVGPWEAAGCVLLAAVAAAVLGTALHGHIWYVDVPGVAGLPVIWGAVAALLQASSLMIVAGVYTGRLWVPAAAGVLSYALVGLAATAFRGNQGIVPFDLVLVRPGPAIAGGVWTLGLIVATVVSVLIVRRANGPRPRG